MDTGQRNHFCSTSGGISMPPVEAPARMTMPSATPMPRPEKMVQRKISSVSTRPSSSRSNSSRKAGLSTLLARVFSANFLPSTAQPHTSMDMLKRKRKPETESPVSRPKASAMPVAPPVMSPAGSRNRATASEYSALPRMIARLFSKSCCQRRVDFIAVPPILSL